MNRLIGLAVLASLSTLSAPVEVRSLQSEQAGVRMILVETEAEAENLRGRIEAGDSFDGLAREFSIDASSNQGGYLGNVPVEQLRGEFQQALAGLEPGEVSGPVQIGSQYYLLGYLSEQEQDWIGQDQLGLEAIVAGNYSEAERAFASAVSFAEVFGVGDFRLAESLENLATVHYSQQDLETARTLYARLLTDLDARTDANRTERLTRVLNRLGEIHRAQGDLVSAEAFYTRSLDHQEATLGAGDPQLATVLSNLAVVRQESGDYTGAEVFLRQALSILERVHGPEDPALAAGLNSLALLLQAQENYTDAEIALRRALGILEQSRRPDDPDIYRIVNNLASVLESQGQYGEAQNLYRRSLQMDWSADRSIQGDTGIAELLEHLTVALRLATFKDDQARQAFDRFRSALESASVEERFVLTLARVLTASGLDDQAETVMLDTADSMPPSRTLRRQLAEMYADDGRMVEAIEQFELGLAIPPSRGTDPVSDRSQRSVFQSRIGDIRFYLREYNASEVAYAAALELDPQNYDTHIGMGHLYVRTDRMEQALASYTRAAQLEPDDVTAHVQIAEANLNMGRFSESYAAAQRAVELDANSLEAHFIRMRALQLLGRSEEAESAIEAYNSREAARRSGTERSLEGYFLSLTAAPLLAGGRYEESVELYRNAIETYPDTAEFYFGLGSVLGRLGRHREAVVTFEELIELGMTDNFLLHKNLATEYALLGDTASSQMHEARYLKTLADSLRSVN